MISIRNKNQQQQQQNLKSIFLHFSETRLSDSATVPATPQTVKHESNKGKCWDGYVQIGL